MAPHIAAMASVATHGVEAGDGTTTAAMTASTTAPSKPPTIQRLATSSTASISPSLLDVSAHGRYLGSGAMSSASRPAARRPPSPRVPLRVVERTRSICGVDRTASPVLLDRQPDARPVRTTSVVRRALGPPRPRSRQTMREHRTPTPRDGLDTVPPPRQPRRPARGGGGPSPWTRQLPPVVSAAPSARAPARGRCHRADRPWRRLAAPAERRRRRPTRGDHAPPRPPPRPPPRRPRPPATTTRRDRGRRRRSPDPPAPPIRRPGPSAPRRRRPVPPPADDVLQALRLPTPP